MKISIETWLKRAKQYAHMVGPYDEVLIRARVIDANYLDGYHTIEVDGNYFDVDAKSVITLQPLKELSPDDVFDDYFPMPED